MVFHLGALWRLNELGYLNRLSRISSVSGGSITAAVLGMNWGRLEFDEAGRARAFEEHVVGPVRSLANRTIDLGAIGRGILTPGRSINDKVAGAYRKLLFSDRTLQDLPDDPRFVINAANVQSGALWRFMKPYMRDWRVGEVKSPTLPLAVAVAASSACPPMLSPAKLRLNPNVFTPDTGEDLQREPYTSDVVLTDGGVYDNLGLETAWKRYDTILVSDAGGRMAAKPNPVRNWLGHGLRVVGVLDNQVRSLRKRQLIWSYKANMREGAYWSSWSSVGNYGIGTSLECPRSRTLELAELSTRLAKLAEEVQMRLVNWGYAICDVAMRKHVDTSLPEPSAFPYPEARV
jgi:NTE family protein